MQVPMQPSYTPPPQNHQSGSSKRDKIRFGIAIALLLFAVGVFGTLVYRFGLDPMAHQNSVSMQQLLMQEESAQPEQSAPAQPDSGAVAGAADAADNPQFAVEALTLPEAGSPAAQEAVAFVRTNNSLVIRYQNQAFLPQVNQEPQPTAVENPELLPWQPLVAPPDTADRAGTDALYSFLATPDTSAFAFVMSWGPAADTGQPVDTRYVLYAYNDQLPQPLRQITTFQEDGQTSQMPKLTHLSEDGQYAAIALYRCYECGNEVPQTVVINLVDGSYRNIGPTSFFSWNPGGVYEYKQYQEVECPTDTQTPEGVTASCAVDPQFLDMQTGRI